MNDEVVETFNAQTFTQGNANITPQIQKCDFFPLREKVKKTEVDRLRNDSGIDIH